MKKSRGPRDASRIALPGQSQWTGLQRRHDGRSSILGRRAQKLKEAGRIDDLGIEITLENKEVLISRHQIIGPRCGGEGEQVVVAGVTANSRPGPGVQINGRLQVQFVDMLSAGRRDETRDAWTRQYVGQFK